MSTQLSETRTALLAEPFERMAEHIRTRASGRAVWFLMNDGNYGDALIRRGAELFLTDAGIDYRAVDTSSRLNKVLAAARGATDPYGRRSLFVYSGGGGWAQHCSVSMRAVARQMAVCADMIVLPSTIEMMPLRRQPTIYRRDHAESRNLLPDAPFCHDMAFYLPLLPRQRWFPDSSAVPVDRERGVFFRRDNESRIVGGSDLAGNEDISQHGNHMSDVTAFLQKIARCEEVITDRLHVAIAAVLLGRRVSLATGSSFKIRAIYEASIAPYFDNCELVSDEVALRRAGGDQ